MSQLQAAVACLIRDKDAGRSGRTSPQQLAVSIAALPSSLLDAPLPSSSKVGNLLLWAVRCGNETAVRLLIARGANVNACCTPKRSAPLMSAAFEGFENIIAVLLSSNADVNQANAQGYTPLIVAAMQGRESCVQLLLRAGANVDQPMTTESAATALLAAAQQGHERCVELLLGAGAQVNRPNENGDVPLGAACYKGQAGCVRLMLQAGAHVDHANARGATPLGLACYAGHACCAALMLEYGATIDHTAHDGRTPMYAACRLGHGGCARLLSSYGARRSAVGRIAANDELNGPATLATAEATCAHYGHSELSAWLRDTRGWESLHHLEELTPRRCLALLRGDDDGCRTVGGDKGCGANIHSKPLTGGDRRTPLERAIALLPQSDVSLLVQSAASPWSTHNHHTFPRAARRRAVELMMLGHQLAAEDRFRGASHAILDAWMHVIMAHAITRCESDDGTDGAGRSE